MTAPTTDALTATTAPESLLAPMLLGAVPLRNRVVMAPMTRSRADADGNTTPLMREYYAQRASAGLIISEGVVVSPRGKGYPNTPNLFTGRNAADWAQIVEGVHAEGGRIFAQLWHVGRMSHPLMQPDGGLPVAPSAVAPEGELYTASGMTPFVAPRALETDEIAGIVAEFRRGAEVAKQAGFDGVEVHGANGYLIDEFLRDGTNHRTDAYGGSVENRMRFLREVVEAVSAVFGTDRVGVRLSPTVAMGGIHDSDPQGTFLQIAAALRPYGLAYLHVIELGSDDFDWQALRTAFGGTYIANGGFDRDRAESAIASGDADLVSFGVPFIANPDLVERFRLDAPLQPGDRATFYGGGAEGYTDYPLLEAAAA